MKNLVYIIIIIISSGCKTPIYQLAYGTDRDNEIDICITDSENTEIKNLTNSNFTEYNFTWSSDGKKIYYTSYEDDGRKIKRIEVESKLIQTLIQDTVIQSVSDVSKDETQLIISTKDHHQKGEFYIYNIVLDSKIRLTNNELYEAGAKFSPDESIIVASIQTQAGDSIYRSGIAEIFTIDINDFSKNQLTNLKGFNALPEYSPNGKSIAFHHCDMGICDIFMMNSDGTNVVNLTKGKDDNRWPRWSPDGKWIAFTKTIDQNSDIYFISADGKIMKPVIESPFRDEIAIFKPSVKGNKRRN